MDPLTELLPEADGLGEGCPLVYRNSYTVLYASSVRNSYLCTYDLYGPVRNAFDAGSIHYEGKWEGEGGGKSRFFFLGGGGL
jgi:hypothetical protein